MMLLTVQTVVSNIKGNKGPCQGHILPLQSLLRNNAVIYWGCYSICNDSLRTLSGAPLA